MKYQKAFALFLAVLLFAGSLGDPIHNVTVYAQEEKKAEENNTMDITAQSAVLIENSSGRILYEKEKDKELIPASITKIMTLLLIFDALEKGQIHLEDAVSVSEYAASMGGS